MFKKKKNNSQIILLIVGFIFLIFISREFKAVESVANLAVRPFASFFSGAGDWFGDRISFFSNIKETKIENDKLANENLKFRFKLSQLKEIENENKTLREELELNKKVKFQTEATLVLGQNLSQNRRIIYLDKGEKNGFSEGDSVVLSDGILIGKITKVYPTSAEAELILDKNTRINAEIQEIGIKGIVQGEYGTSVIMGMIPQSAEVKENQTVITSGLGGEFPRGLLIGRIKEVEMTIDRLFQQASIESPVEFRDLRMVWVINNK